MNKIFKTFFAVASLASIVTIYSCTKTCDTGYEGDKCDVKMNAKFVGTYAVKDTAVFTDTTMIFNYSMTINAASSDPQGVTITNFGGLGAGSIINGTVDGTDLSIPNTTIGAVAISNASGSIDGNTLHFNYTATDNLGAGVSHAVGLK